MVHSIHEMQGYTIQVTDGKIGKVHDFLFDDAGWTVRYLVVDTGGWLSGRRVLISPIAIRAARWNDQVIEVHLTRHQVEQSPGIETDKPVSRQKEIEYAGYYGYAPYWNGLGVWGAGVYPGAMHPVVKPLPAGAPVNRTEHQGTPAVKPLPAGAPVDRLEHQGASTENAGDPHLRSTREVMGYTIQASDDSIGHVDDFMVDDDTWELRYMVVDTSTWLPGDHVLIAPSWISNISWDESRVFVELPRATIEHAPPFDLYTPVSPEYEARLHAYYQQSV